jgi:hypothetical protein
MLTGELTSELEGSSSNIPDSRFDVDDNVSDITLMVIEEAGDLLMDEWLTRNWLGGPTALMVSKPPLQCFNPDMSNVASSPPRLLTPTSCGWVPSANLTVLGSEPPPSSRKRRGKVWHTMQDKEHEQF